MLYEVITQETENNEASIKLYDYIVWTPDNPFLYTIKITAGDDKIESYFARITSYNVCYTKLLRWENKVKTDYPKRAEGLHKVLYQCPNCKTEYRMASKDDKIMCTHCGKSWTMSEYGRLSADEGGTEFTHIPDWYEWERANVKKEVETGAYSFSGEARVDSLPNSYNFV